MCTDGPYVAAEYLCVVSMSMCICLSSRVCVRVYVCTCVPVCMYVCMYVCIYVCVCVCV